MSFSFNFDVLTTKCQQGEENQPQDGKVYRAVEPVLGNTITTREDTVKAAVEHFLLASPHSLLNNAVSETITIGTLPPLSFLNESVFELTAGERDDEETILSQTATQSSDLISGVYEGGLKVWECTYDLLELLERDRETFSEKIVLDLGCGAGLLGILALKRGASKVHFQDYNSTVIEHLTLPNTLLNCLVEEEDEKGRKGKQESNNEVIVEEEEENTKNKEKVKSELNKLKKEDVVDGRPLAKRQALDSPQHPKLSGCRFFSGDWTTFLTLMLKEDPSPKYDIIFTAETIYNKAYYSALHNTLHRLLAPGGVIYLATKTHYFGVGGGLHLFEQFVEEKGVFDMEKLWVVEHGLQRHVVAMHFKTKYKS